MAKHTYHIEVHDGTRWARLIGYVSQGYGFGYLDAMRNAPGPTLDYRLVRSDGKVVHEESGTKDVTIGMIAGFPTAQQYRDAAERALQRAEQIDAINDRKRDA